jgi:hypothetical protein
MTKKTGTRNVEDTKEVIRSRQLKDRQHNGKEEKKTNNDLLNITQKTNDRATPLKPGVNSGVPER